MILTQKTFAYIPVVKCPGFVLFLQQSSVVVIISRLFVRRCISIECTCPSGNGQNKCKM